ncbi:DUF262 domain-containing protein [Nocardia sp. NPDC003482]
MSDSKELILQPEYQRKAVWPNRAKVSLMETILLGYPIPEIYLAYETSPDGEQTVSVVDGQQRLTALLEFLDNKYPLDGLEDEALRGKFEGYYFRDLPPNVRQKFFQYRFPIRRLSDLGDDFVRAVFARVNRVNMVLTDQELRNALLPGEFYEFLKDCASHEINDVSGVFSGERRKRGGDLEFYAEIFGTCIFGVSNKKAELDERYNVFASDFATYEEQARKFLELLTLLKIVIKWEGRTRWSNIVDLYTLIHAGWNSFEDIKSASVVKQRSYREIFDLFQRAVSSFRRDLSQNEISDESANLIEGISARIQLPQEEVSAIINEYLSGIRNSSDLGSRRARLQSLTKVITRVS